MLLARPLLRPRHTLWTRSVGTGPAAKPPARRSIKVMQIDDDGKRTSYDCTGGELARSFGLAPRDLRLLATRNINMAVRETYFLFRFPPFTGIVSSDRAVLVHGSETSMPRSSSQQGYDCLATQVLEAEISRAVHRPTKLAGDFAGYLYDGLLQRPLPFELRVLDSVLREDLNRKGVRATHPLPARTLWLDSQGDLLLPLPTTIYMYTCNIYMMVCVCGVCVASARPSPFYKNCSGCVSTSPLTPRLCLKAAHAPSRVCLFLAKYCNWRPGSRLVTLHVEYAERRRNYCVLFIASLFCEYINLECVRVPVIYRVKPAE